LSWLTRIRDCNARKAQNCFVVEIVQAGGLSILKIDARLAAQHGVDGDPFQIVVSLETGCSRLRQILSSDLMAGAMKTGVQFGAAFA